MRNGNAKNFKYLKVSSGQQKKNEVGREWGDSGLT
jgi:hypothetical protein